MITRRIDRARDGGFSLVELLVVIVILGIIAVIAVPLLVQQRRQAADSALKSDLRLAAGAIEVLRTDGTEVTRAELGKSLRLSPGTEVSVHLDGDSFCLVASRASGAASSQDWVYVGAAGLGEKGVTTCPGSADFVHP